MKVKIAAMLAAFLIAVSGALIVLNEQKWVIPKADSILPSVSASDTDNYTGNTEPGNDTETPPDEGDDGNGGGSGPGGGGGDTGDTPGDDTEIPPEEPEVPGVIRFYTLNTGKSIYYLVEPVSIFGTILISNAVLPESVVVTFNVYNSLTPASISSTTLVAQLKADVECTALPSATATAETTAEAAGYGYSCKFKTSISDGFKKEGKYTVFAKASGTTITTVINEVTKTTKFVVVQKTVPEPSEPSILRIKAYDVNTGDLVPGAITIVLWVSDLPITTSATAGGTGAGGGPAVPTVAEGIEPVPAPTAAAILPSVFALIPGDANCNGVVNIADVTFLANYLNGGPVGDCGSQVMDVNADGTINQADANYLLDYLRGTGPAPVKPEGPDDIEGPGTVPPSIVPREGIVVGIIKANGIDSITLKPGKYNLITYAKGYTLYRHWGLLIKPGQEYGLYAPMSKGIVTKPPTVIKPITEIAIPVTEATPGGIVVKIMPTVVKKPVEVIYPGTEAAISIRAVEEGEKGKFVLEADNIEAITDAAVEIEEKKLYIKTDEAKTQVKILPSTAAERAQEALLSHRIKTIILEIVNKKPFYTIDGEQDANMLGFIPTKIPVTIKVSAETGEVTDIAKPFWAILAIPVSR